MEGTPCHPRGLTDGAAALRPFVTSCAAICSPCSPQRRLGGPIPLRQVRVGREADQLGPGLLSGPRVQFCRLLGLGTEPRTASRFMHPIEAPSGAGGLPIKKAKHAKASPLSFFAAAMLVLGIPTFQSAPLWLRSKLPWSKSPQSPKDAQQG